MFTENSNNSSWRFSQENSLGKSAPSATLRPVRIKRALLARISVAALMAVGFTLSLCLDFVDHHPYFKQNYYSQTIDRLKNATNSIARRQGELKAGFGIARLTPTIHSETQEAMSGRFRSLPLAGYGNRNGTPATGVHDDLYVKTVAIQVEDLVAVMFGVDALIIPREVSDAAAERLRQELGLGREQLYFSASHTHCSLGGWGEGWVGEAFAGGFNPAARTWFAECLVSAAKEAMRDLKPARYGYGGFLAPDFVRNRLVGTAGRTDPEFALSVLAQSGGRTGVLGSFSAHATVLSGAVMEWSADYPGYWQRAVEGASGGPAIFLAGGVGSHGPVPGASGFAGAQRMGETLAERTRQAIGAIVLTNRLELAALGLNVILPPLNTRVSDSVRLRPWVSKRLLTGAGRDSFLQVLRIGHSLWISTPCDFSGELALDAKHLMFARGYDATVTSFNGDYIGYVIPRRYYHLPGYEPRVMSFYGPNVPDYLTDLIQRMALAITAN